MKEISILIVDDEPIIQHKIGEYLSDLSFSIFLAANQQQTLSILAAETIDIVILDIRLPDCNGLDLLKKIKNEQPNLEVIMITGHGGSQDIIQAMRNGASDYFRKPFRLEEIKNAIKRTNRYLQLNSRIDVLESRIQILLKEVPRFKENIIGQSQALSQIVDMAIKAASSDDASILITGPSGAGKELIAQLIHYASNRKQEFLYPINCAAIPADLLESELFGYKKGAFTGATSDKKGLVEQANGGTLFLDEIGDMPMPLQAKMLRVLEDRKVRPIGGVKDIPVNIRIISASNQNISQMIEEQKFRHDLYYRLNTFELSLPALYERKEDIPLLANHFLRHLSQKMRKPIFGFSHDALAALINYDYPGNIRELKNIIERAIILCDPQTGCQKIEKRHLMLSHTKLDVDSDPDSRSQRGAVPTANQGSGAHQNCDTLDLELLEKQAIDKAMQISQGNKTKAAKILNISRNALLRRIAKYAP